MQLEVEWIALLTLTSSLLFSAATECDFTVTGSANGSNYISITAGENVTITGKVEYKCSSSVYSSYLPLWHFQSNEHPSYKSLDHVPNLPSNLFPSAIPQCKILPYNRQLQVQYFNLTLIAVKSEYKFIVLRPGIHVGPKTSHNDVMAKSAVMVEVLPREFTDATTVYSRGSETPTHISTASDNAAISSSEPTGISYSSMLPTIIENGNNRQVRGTDEEQTSALPRTTVANSSWEGSTIVATYILVGIGSAIVGVLATSGAAFVIFKHKLKRLEETERERKTSCSSHTCMIDS